jgi:multiple sugar transport system substrate-binding protein
MIYKTMSAALLSSALLVSAAQAQQVVEWWDFLGGGDGVRMKTLIDEFNAEHSGEIQINATTLEWGIPFYTKVQTSAAVGEGPDIMTITPRGSRWQ